MDIPEQELSVSDLELTQGMTLENSVKEREEWFRTSVEALLDGLAIFSSIRDENGRIVDFRYEYINEAGCHLNQRSREEQIGHTLLELLPMHRETGLLDEYIRVVETGEPYVKENLLYEDIYSRKRLARTFDMRVMKLGDGIVTHWRDVTARNHLEQSETEQRVLAKTLEETARILNSTLYLDEVLDRILLQVERVVPYDAAHIMLVDSGITRIVRSQGYTEDGQKEAIYNLRLNIEEIKNLRRMAETGQPIAIPDTWTSEDWVEIPESRWIRSYAGAPLQVEGQTIGFINANSITPGIYNSTHARCLQAFANHAAVAIMNARLFEDLQRFARQSALLNDITTAAVSAPEKNTMLQNLADRLGELIDADGAFITLWDEEQQKPVPAAAHGPLKQIYSTIKVEPSDITLTASVLQTGKVLVVNDTSNTPIINPRIAAQFPSKSVLGLPLIADKKKLGAAFISFNQPHRFTSDEIAIAKQAAAQIALAIWKAQLLETEQERTAQLGRANSLIMALGQVAAKIDAASDPDEVLNTMGNELRKLGVMCMVALHSIETQTLQVQYISLDSNAMASAEKVTGVKLRDHHLSSERFPFYEEVMEHGQSVFSIKPLKVITTSFSGLSRAQVQRFEKLIGLTNRTKSIFLPLIAREKVVGTLWMWGDNLLESDLSAATIFASQVAVTLENARLYREIIRLAVTDELTGLYNRRGGLELGQREFERAKRHGRALSAILLDIDHFKDVNDTHGHIVGDQVLKVLSERFGNHLRATDIAVRYGGEEFLVLLPEANLSSAYEIAERLRRLTADLVVLAEQRNIQISISAGVAERNPGMKELMALVKCADEALYLAKQSGRNQVVAT